jgi:hypothetical protein
VDQLRLAELWFDVDSGETVPVAREHGIWLFKTAADEIERLRVRTQQLETERDEWRAKASL